MRTITVFIIIVRNCKQLKHSFYALLLTNLTALTVNLITLTQ